MGKTGINKKSILFVVIIFSILTFLESRMITASMKALHRHNQIYITAQKVNNSPDDFKKCINLRTGDVLAYGMLEANDPVSFDKLDGEFYYIQCIKERYNMYTRPVTKSTGTGKNKHTYVSQETYYKWDVVNKEEKSASNVSFLNQTINTSMLKNVSPYRLNIDSYIKPKYKNKVRNNYLYKSSTIIHACGDVRYLYRYVPKSFNCTLEINTSSGSIEPMTGNKITISRMNLDEYMNKINNSEKIIKFLLYFISIISSIILSIIISSKINIDEIHEKEKISI